MTNSAEIPPQHLIDTRVARRLRIDHGHIRTSGGEEQLDHRGIVSSFPRIVHHEVQGRVQDGSAPRILGLKRRPEARVSAVDDTG
mgnify:CR=1 FL=1